MSKKNPTGTQRLFYGDDKLRVCQNALTWISAADACFNICWAFSRRCLSCGDVLLRSVCCWITRTTPFSCFAFTDVRVCLCVRNVAVPQCKHLVGLSVSCRLQYKFPRGLTLCSKSHQKIFCRGTSCFFFFYYLLLQCVFWPGDVLYKRIKSQSPPKAFLLNQLSDFRTRPQAKANV